MNHRLTAIATTGAIITSFFFAPISAVMAKPSSKLPTNMILAAAPNGNLLKDIPFSSTVSDGSVIGGTISITQFAYSNGQLLATGTINAVATINGTTTNVIQTFTTPATLTSSTTKAASCDILFLDLGPIFLDVLGLTVDLSEIVLDIDAVTGSGNLLGNLLCALTGLLDGGPLASILQLINQINNILAG
ncbi:MAG TPA: ABC transporter substrate-binding protein [Cyanobacteria bacterium UBA12227]|nr:ABC transporter substrate-binding protein [Cyanobacteria bacterium UBA12227]HAX87097.1 ABC transporter substrate-binding protein [Cyanobacteria bacterium UBA11370]HBY75977.1 ABC transporter substrate-binding protein [Cyanobacteria bacterium UBA11148]